MKNGKLQKSNENFFSPPIFGMLNNVVDKLINRIPENNRVERIWKLAQLDFKKRYYNDNLGILWSLLEPLFRIGIYYFIFKVVLKVKESIQAKHS